MRSCTIDYAEPTIDILSDSCSLGRERERARFREDVKLTRDVKTTLGCVGNDLDETRFDTIIYSPATPKAHT